MQDKKSSCKPKLKLAKKFESNSQLAPLRRVTLPRCKPKLKLAKKFESNSQRMA